MSRTGKKPIAPVSGVTVAINDRIVTAKGPKGEQSLTLMDIVNAKQTDQGIVIEPANDSQEARAAWGTTRALIANMVKGVKDGFEKKLQIQGVGFRAAMQGKDLKLSLGFSHEVLHLAEQGQVQPGAVGGLDDLAQRHPCQIRPDRVDGQSEETEWSASAVLSKHCNFPCDKAPESRKTPGPQKRRALTRFADHGDARRFIRLKIELGLAVVNRELTLSDNFLSSRPEACLAFLFVESGEGAPLTVNGGKFSYRGAIYGGPTTSPGKAEISGTFKSPTKVVGKARFSWSDVPLVSGQSGPCDSGKLTLAAVHG